MKKVNFSVVAIVLAVFAILLACYGAYYGINARKFERSFDLPRVENVLTLGESMTHAIEYKVGTETKSTITTISFFEKPVKEGDWYRGLVSQYRGLVMIDAPETRLTLWLVPDMPQKLCGIRFELKYDIAKAKTLGFIPGNFATNFRVEVEWPTTQDMSSLPSKTID